MRGPATAATTQGCLARASDPQVCADCPGGEVAAPVDLIEVGGAGIGLLGPAARGPEDLAGEHREADRELDLRRSLPGRQGFRHPRVDLRGLGVPGGVWGRGHDLQIADPL